MKKGMCYARCNQENGQKRGNDMNQIGSMFLVGAMGILGGIPTLYILISLPVILVQKIFGKIKYGKSLYQ